MKQTRSLHNEELEKRTNKNVSDQHIEPNATTYAAIDAAKSHENIYGPFANADSLMEEFNKKK